MEFLIGVVATATPSAALEFWCIYYSPYYLSRQLFLSEYKKKEEMLTFDIQLGQQLRTTIYKLDLYNMQIRLLYNIDFVKSDENALVFLLWTTPS